MNVTIRDMTAGDADEVCALVQANYDGAIAACHSPEEVARLRAVVTPAWVAGQLEWSRVFVAVDEGEGILATAALADLGPTAPRRYCVRQCFVRADRHLRGLGARIMGEVCAAARDAGAPGFTCRAAATRSPSTSVSASSSTPGSPRPATRLLGCPWRCEAPAEQAHEPDAPEAGSRLMGSGAQVMCRTLGGRGAGAMWRVVVGKVAVTIGIVLVASGCGTTAASDPFVGSWSASGKTSADAVISRTSDGYRVTLLAYGGAPLDVVLQAPRRPARGDRKRQGGLALPLEHRRRAARGQRRLFWTEGGETVKLSASAAALPSLRHRPRAPDGCRAA